MISNNNGIQAFGGTDCRAIGLFGRATHLDSVRRPQSLEQSLRRKTVCFKAEASEKRSRLFG